MAIVVDNFSTEKRSFTFFLPAILGTILEYYDYALYGFCSAKLAVHFFREDDPTVALLKFFGVFIAGSCAKPLGALIFGYIGDQFGRSPALKMSLFGIIVPTLVVGLLPGYDDIGWLAPLLLLLCRITQGMLVSGEYEGVRIFMFEFLGKENPHFVNSLSNFASYLGIYFASVAVMLTTSQDLPDWIWRLPFIVGGVLGIFIVWVRRHYLQETPEYVRYRARNPKREINSWISILKRNKRTCLAAILLYGTAGGGYHFYFVFFGNYLQSSLGFVESAQSAFNVSISILIYSVCGPLAGWLCDRYGPFLIAKIAFYSLLPLIALNIYMLAQSVMPFWLMGLTAGTLAFFHVPGAVTLLQKFEVSIRFRCSSLSHALGSMLFSGTAPLMSLWIWRTTNIEIAPLFYFGLLCLLGFFAIREILNTNATQLLDSRTRGNDVDGFKATECINQLTDIK